MRTMVLATALAALLSGGKKDPAKATPPDPNEAASKSHGGKVWVRGGESLPQAAGGELSSWLGAHPPSGAITRKAKDTPWSVTYLAVFRKPAAKGPMTVQFLEKKDKGLVDQYSPENDEAARVFRGKYDLDPDRGFNAGHTYLIKVGQILNKQFVAYATGELTLK